MPTETVVLEGELDFETSFNVEMRLELAISRADAVVVDLSRLEFIDSTGIRTLLEAMKAAEREKTPIQLRPAKPEVQRIFEVAGLLDALPFAA
jgi:anti-sigma B factor antagonist